MFVDFGKKKLFLVFFGRHFKSNHDQDDGNFEAAATFFRLFNLTQAATV